MENTIAKKKINIGTAVLGALQIAALLVPVFFLDNILLWGIEEDFGITIFVIPALCGIFTGITVYSDTLVQALVKWFFSLPVTAVLWFYSVKTEFYMRSLNWVFPGYGEPSAGGGFAAMLLLFSILFFDIFAVLVGCICSAVIKPSGCKRFFPLVQKILCPIICGIILAVFLLLSIAMPRYVHVYG